MSTVEEIEEAISRLPEPEIRRLAEWLQARQATGWDRQIEEDAGAGKLDFLFEEADAERVSEDLRNWPEDGKA